MEKKSLDSRNMLLEISFLLHNIQFKLIQKTYKQNQENKTNRKNSSLKMLPIQS